LQDKENISLKPGTKITIGRFIAFCGFAILLSALVINPWMGKYWRDTHINFQDVFLIYFYWGIGTSAVLILAGVVFSKTKSALIENVIFMILILSLFLMSDRFLLSKFGLPLWMPDLQNHFVHRPNATKTWGKEFDNKLIQTNPYGHHDDEFPIEKAANEFRALMLGDSITMGHGVTHREAFPNQVEQLLTKQPAGNFQSYQIINTGVQGYSTFQERQVLSRSLVFQPDMVFIGFCMNDVIEPFIVNKQFGGKGIDYHEVSQVSNRVLSHLVNETGYGRLLYKIRTHKQSVNQEKEKEKYNVMYMAMNSTQDKDIQNAWKLVIDEMTKIKNISAEHHLNSTILIFPHTFQIFDTSLQSPQTILREFATQNNIDVIDFTDVFSKRIDSELTRDTNREVLIKKYFLDEDHYTVEGHRIVAEYISNYIRLKLTAQ